MIQEIPLAKIDTLAKISPDAQLANDVEIGPFSVIEAGVKIGAGTKIASNVLICRGTTIGRNNRIGHGTVIGTLPQYIGFDESLETTVEIGDNNTIREYVTINRGTEHNLKTVMGSNCYIMTYCHLGHDCELGNNITMANGVNLGGHVIVEDYVGIGGMTPAHQFCRIGAHSFIGGGLLITKDVPPYILAMGSPLTFGGLNRVGLSRRGYDKEKLKKVKQAYRFLYMKKMNVSQALKAIQSEMEMTPEIEHIVKFVESSKRGIIK
jgi:UDP-N-acetylglucosamine acyltransferase